METNRDKNKAKEEEELTKLGMGEGGWGGRT
jgi:hypothetical protein